MSGHVTRMFCAVAAGFALIASGLATACAAGAASAARPGLSGRTAQSTTSVCCGVSAVAVTSARNAWAPSGRVLVRQSVTAEPPAGMRSLPDPTVP